MLNEKKLELLSKTTWRICDIMNYYGCSESKASRLKNRAIAEFDGGVPYGKTYVDVDALLKMFGTNRAKEINVIKEALYGSKV